jgi:hypothetical protein
LSQRWVTAAAGEHPQKPEREEARAESAGCHRGNIVGRESLVKSTRVPSANGSTPTGRAARGGRHPPAAGSTPRGSKPPSADTTSTGGRLA